MIILTRKKKNAIAKQLAAIYYTAVYWKNEDWVNFVRAIVGNCTEIAYAIGGERMAHIEVPALVMQLEERCKQGDKK